MFLLPLLVLACTPADGGDGGGDSGGADGGAGAAKDLLLGDIQPCDAPLPAPGWTDQAQAWGLPAPADPLEVDSQGATAVLADLDLDGDLDLVLSYGEEGEGVHLLWREGEGFAGEQLPVDEVNGPGLGDLDGDGWPDLSFGGEQPVLLRNLGGSFEVVALALGTHDLVRELLPVDLDGDGDLDLAAGFSSPESGLSQDRILWNDGDPWTGFSQTLLEGDAATGEAFDLLAWDRDGDHDLDLYTVNDMGDARGPNGLFDNDDGAFTDIAPELFAAIAMDGMGGSVGDFDADGHADLYLAGSGSSHLLQGQADGSFVDLTLATGADPIEVEHHMAWGSAWWDADNDGFLDLAIAQGDFDAEHLDRPQEVQPLRLMRQQDGVFQDVGASWLSDLDAHWRVVIPVELNGDGVLDLLATRMDERPALFLSTGCTAASWLGVEAPVGSVVTVTAGGRSQRAWVTADVGYGGVRPGFAWFGLGEEPSADRVEVVLPVSGQRFTAEQVQARRWLRPAF